jgi:AcrR family transcriptional regulator
MPTVTRPARRKPAQGTAAPRGSLNRDSIEAAALALIEAHGLEGFSTRKLGQQLGCEAMSIYYHFPSKAHLLDALVDRLLNEVPLPTPENSPGQRIRHLAQAWRVMSRRYPRFYLWMALHRWNSESGVRFLSEVLDAFHAAGLEPERVARGFRVLGYYLLGATLEETSGYAQGPSSLTPLREDEVQRRYPLVAQAGPYFSPEQFDDTFELGLAILIQGLGIVD